MNYTPQELILKKKCAEANLSFCMYRDFVLIWGNNTVFTKQVENMHDWLGA